MQYDPSNQGYNNDGNQYPPMNQVPQSVTGNAYPPNSVPPPSAQYPQQPPGTSYYGQTPASNPQCVVVTHGYQPENLLFTPITPNIKVFLIISGSLYLIWWILGIGLDIGIIRTIGTYSLFGGFAASGFFLSGGILMLVAASKASYVRLYLLQMFIVTLIFSVLGLILSIVGPLLSLRTTYLQIVLIVVFVISTVQTIANIIVIINSRNNTMLISTSNVPGNA